MNTLVLTIAVILAISTIGIAMAQVDEVTVPAVNGTPVEVPTVAQAAENATNSIIAMIIAIISLIALVLKSGILDSVIGAKRKEQIKQGSEAVLVALVKALENKILIRKTYELAFSTASEEKKAEYAALIKNLDDQIKYTTEQIHFYSDHFPMHVDPDANKALPRESMNIATRKLVHDTFTIDQAGK